MILTNKLQLDLTSKQVDILSELSYGCNKIWNACVYHNEEKYEKDEEFLWEGDLFSFLKGHPWYKALPSQTAQEVIKDFDRALQTYLSKLEKFKDGEMENQPSFPGYRKNSSLRTIPFNNQQIDVDFEENRIRFGLSKEMRDKFDIKLRGPNSGVQLPFNPDSLLHGGEARTLQLVNKDGVWKAHLQVEVEEPDLKNTGNEAAGDLGINNLLTLSLSNSEDQIVFSGKKYKSIRHYFDKKISEEQEKVNKYSKEYDSSNLKRLRRKKKRQLDHLAQKMTKQVPEILDENEIDTLYIGDLEGIREGKNWGSKGNKQLHGWFFKKLTSLLRYKLRMKGIRLKQVNERGTSSKCCFCDSSDCSSRQRSRYYCSCEDKIIHSDVNGAVNILKKHYSGKEDEISHLINPIQIMDKMAYPSVLTWNEHEFCERSS